MGNKAKKNTNRIGIGLEHPKLAFRPKFGQSKWFGYKVKFKLMEKLIFIPKLTLQIPLLVN